MYPRPWIVAAAASSMSLLAFSALHVIPASGAEPKLHFAASVSDLPAGAATASADASDPAVATTLDKYQAKGVLGSAVRSAADEDMGRIIDVVVDRAGTPRAAVIDFGGFLGVGSRKVAIDWNAIRFNRTDIRLDLTRDQVKSAPQYQEGKPVVILGSAADYARSQFSERVTEP